MYKLFNDTFGWYIYSPSINTINSISYDLFMALSRKSDIDQNSTLADEYNRIKSKGYFDENEPHFSPLNAAQINDLVNRMTSQITIQITQDCNFRCTYCPYTNNTGLERTHNAKYISWKTCKAALDFLHSCSYDHPYISIGFYGGEPILGYSIIKQAIEYSESIFEGKKIHFQITTNASILNEEILSFFQEHNVTITISIDGPKRINDKNRKYYLSNKSTFDSISRKLETISTRFPELARTVSINMVLDPSIPYNLYLDIFSEIQNIARFTINASVLSDTDLEKKNHYCDEFVAGNEYAQFIGRYVRDNNDIKESNKLRKQNIMDISIQKSCEQVSEMIDERKLMPYPAGQCIPGYTRLFVDVNGRLLPCEKVSEIIPDIEIGDVWHGYNLEKLEKIINVYKLSEKECKQCWCYPLCTSCIRLSLSEKGLDRRTRLSHCEECKNIAVEMLKLYVSLHRQDYK